MNKTVKQIKPAFLPFLTACEIIGFNSKTSRNWLNEERFPLPTEKINGMLVVPTVAVDVYIDTVTESSLQNLPHSVADFFRGEIKARKQTQFTPPAVLKGKPGRKAKGAGAGSTLNSTIIK